MELLILGQTSDDKGTQLEQLTKYLLQEMGYVDVVVNSVGAGGQEIDVQAEIKMPSLDGEQRTRVICECKAHKEPVAISDWLKFLGKLFVEESRLRKHVYGCFIALSGVNGNVEGNFDILHEYREDIELIRGDALVRLLAKKFNLISIGEIAECIRNLTSRQFTSISLCYYDYKIHWLAKFEGDKFTVLSNEGKAITSSENADLLDIISNCIDVNEFIDLQAEAEAQQRARFIDKIILSELFLLRGEGTCDDILQNWLKSCTDDKWQQISSNELAEAAQRLNDQSILNINHENQILKLLPDNIADCAKRMSAVYKYLFAGETPLVAFGCPFYDEHIDFELLNVICAIQGNLILPEERRDDCLKLLRWSPGALAWALHPEPLIVNHRKDASTTEMFEKIDADLFIRQLLARFNQDFNLRPLEKYFYTTRNLREVDTKQMVEIKGAKASQMVIEVRSRIGIGELNESSGGGLIRILITEDSPEPWNLHPSEPSGDISEPKGG